MSAPWRRWRGRSYGTDLEMWARCDATQTTPMQGVARHPQDTKVDAAPPVMDLEDIEVEPVAPPVMDLEDIEVETAAPPVTDLEDTEVETAAPPVMESWMAVAPPETGLAHLSLQTAPPL